MEKLFRTNRTEPVEGTLFTSGEGQNTKKKRHHSYRTPYRPGNSDSNKRHWMELFPAPKGGSSKRKGGAGDALA